MADRYRAYREPFTTPFSVEGWALYWELLLWDLDFPRSPEDRVGMLVWPYTHACGLKLVFYLLGATAVAVAGVWSALTSWKRRLGIAHAFSIILIIWGLALAGRQLLPRFYGKTPVPFFCPEP